MQQSNSEQVALLDETVAQLQKDIVQLKKDHQAQLKELEVATRQQVKAEHDKTVLELEKQHVAKQERVQKAKEMAEKEHAETRGKLKGIESNAQQMQKQVQQLQRQLTQAQQQAEYWQGAFEGRSLVNVTHWMHDAQTWMAHSRSSTRKGWETTQTRLVQHPYYVQACQTVEPYQQQVQNWYVKHAQPHVTPVWNQMQQAYQQYVAPPLQQGQKQVANMVTDVRDYLGGLLQSVVKDIHRSCPQWKKQWKQGPEFVVTNLDALCREPQAHVVRILSIVGLVWAFVFRHFLYKSLVRLVTVLWVVTYKFWVGALYCLWYISPIRVLFVVIPRLLFSWLGPTTTKEISAEKITNTAAQGTKKNAQ
uniref:Uncharacterized protein n=1 Tax=Entomoneis paludosa TaxID=265537 RepID=A0A7S2V7F9_9STRA